MPTRSSKQLGNGGLPCGVKALFMKPVLSRSSVPIIQLALDNQEVSNRQEETGMTTRFTRQIQRFSCESSLWFCRAHLLVPQKPAIAQYQKHANSHLFQNIHCRSREFSTWIIRFISPVFRNKLVFHVQTSYELKAHHEGKRLFALLRVASWVVFRRKPDTFELGTTQQENWACKSKAL